jgi:hypothetical protein
MKANTRKIRKCDKITQKRIVGDSKLSYAQHIINHPILQDTLSRENGKYVVNYNT